MTAEPVYDLTPPAAAEVPLLVSVPHTGTLVPASIAERFASAAVRELPDTDFHLHVVYDFVPRLGATLLCARYSRYVVDLNRSSDGGALYPGRDETSVVPTSTFGSERIYRPGTEPDAAEIADRVANYWRPYHDRLRAELDRIKAQFGYALLWDGHSIQSHVPRFFDGELPGLMLGDVDGRSADPRLSAAVLEVQRASGYSFRANSPFKGGYITRSFGDPAKGIHALQLEMSQRLYMDEAPPFPLDLERTKTLRPVLQRCLDAYVTTARALFG